MEKEIKARKNSHTKRMKKVTHRKNATFAKDTQDRWRNKRRDINMEAERPRAHTRTHADTHRDQTSYMAVRRRKLQEKV